MSPSKISTTLFSSPAKNPTKSPTSTSSTSSTSSDGNILIYLNTPGRQLNIKPNNRIHLTEHTAPAAALRQLREEIRYWQRRETDGAGGKKLNAKEALMLGRMKQAEEVIVRWMKREGIDEEGGEGEEEVQVQEALELKGGGGDGGRGRCVVM